MFIGHYAVGLAAKSISRKPSLGTYFAAVSLLDLLWPVFLLLGIEKAVILPDNTPFLRLEFTYYPWSHSLLSTLVWATVFSGIYYTIRRDRNGASWIWFGVASHWVLDAITHRPDLSLFPGSSTLVGAGLWNDPVFTIILEGILFTIGIILYLRSTTASDTVGIVSFWVLITIFVISYFASIVGPPPPGIDALGWTGIGSYLFVLWGYWIDRHRNPLPGT